MLLEYLLYDILRRSEHIDMRLGRIAFDVGASGLGSISQTLKDLLI
jgi:hypothetical protein